MTGKWEDCQAECRKMYSCRFFSFSSRGCVLVSSIFNKEEVSDIKAVSGSKECAA